MRITFLGAAGEVTGSQHLLETDAVRLLLDCGLFQGARTQTSSRNRHFDCRPGDLDGVILSHAHIDHCGNLPGLHRSGFTGPIFCTPATADVAGIMLRDSARIQLEDAQRRQTDVPRTDIPETPLYTKQDVKAVEQQFRPLALHEWHVLSNTLRIRFVDAGHILGSAICEVDIRDGRDWRRVVYTGDLGRRDQPLLPDPQTVDACDVLISECTYGDRVHPPAAGIKTELERIISAAVERQGRLIVPAFSLGRTQHFLWLLRELFHDGRLPGIPIFIDSPLGTRIGDVYRRNCDQLRENVRHLFDSGHDAFDLPGLTTVRSQQESQALNHRSGPFIVIAASGMCDGGRVVHHLKHAITNPANAVLLIGYQAAHTPGRQLAERRPTVRILDQDYPLRAEVHVIHGLSAHADADDFRWWFGGLSANGGANQVFLVHGESTAAGALAHLIRDDCNSDPIVPGFGATYEINGDRSGETQ